MRAFGKITVVRAALFLFFLFAAVLPLLGMFAGLFSPEAQSVFGSERFAAACMNSLGVALAATAISVPLALVMSWVLCRTNIRGKGVVAVVMTLPMLIPSLAHGMGLVFLLGSNGVFTNLFGLGFSIYGFWGIVLGSVLYSFPSAFLLIYDVMKYEDASAYEAARVLGIPKINQFTSITLPYLRKPLISAAFATFTLVVTDYGVPLMVGGKTITLPVLMYQEVIGLLNFDTGIAVGFVLLIPAVIAFVVDMLNADKGKMSFVSTGFSLSSSHLRDAAGYVVSAATSLFVLLPLASFVLVSFVRKYPVDMSFTFDNIGRSLNMGMGAYLINSLEIALAVASVGTVLAYASALRHGSHGRTVCTDPASGMHHDPCHSGYSVGCFVRDVLQRVVFVRNAGHPGASQPGALFRITLSDGLQRPWQGEREPGGCGVFHGNRAHQHSQGCLGSPNRRYDRRDVLVLLRELYGDYFRGCFFGYDARHAVGSAHHRFGRATPD